MALKICGNLPQKLVGGGIGGRWEVDPKRCGRWEIGPKNRWEIGG